MIEYNYNQNIIEQVSKSLKSVNIPQLLQFLLINLKVFIKLVTLRVIRTYFLKDS